MFVQTSGDTSRAQQADDTDTRHAVVVFDKDHELPLKSTPQEIRNQIGAASTPHIPLLELKDPRGELVWVNAKQIRAYHAYRGE